MQKTFFIMVRTHYDAKPSKSVLMFSVYFPGIMLFRFVVEVTSYSSAGESIVCEDL